MMFEIDKDNLKICVVGLGYVGLPLAVEFGKYLGVKGFDISEKRIKELKSFQDTTNELTPDELKNTRLEATSDPKAISESNFIIVAVPTPIDNNFNPDLKHVKSASQIVGKNMKKGTVVVYESTVYPGVTEEVCLPIIEKESGLKHKYDFKLGYSPERINPGDKEHTVDKIVKIVSGCDDEALEIISEVYAKIIKAGIHKAPDIKTAEAAKVIENIQRDLNIALVNELKIIFDKLGVDTNEVIEAAATKWNFHKYTPGLVGGHCIGVDPYYLTYKAKQTGYYPKVILAGRETNEFMAEYFAKKCIKALNDAGKILKDSTVLVMGLTFKENVKDARNSKAKELIKHLKDSGVNVTGYDPLLSNDMIEKEFGVKNHKLEDIDNIDAVIITSAHDEIKRISKKWYDKIMPKGRIIIDIKND